MFATTTNEFNIPTIICEEQAEENISGIENPFSEYTTGSVSEPKSNILNDILQYLNISAQNDKMQYDTSTNILSGVNMSKYCKAKNEIEVLGHLYKFKEEFTYLITIEDEGVIAKNDYFNIFGYGDTVEEAEQELFEYINDLWEIYAEENDENLDESAIKLKENLLEKIRKIY